MFRNFSGWPRIATVCVAMTCAGLMLASATVVPPLA